MKTYINYFVEDITYKVDIVDDPSNTDGRYFVGLPYETEEEAEKAISTLNNGHYRIVKVYSVKYQN